MNYDALLLVSFGGPEGPTDVMPFLENVTRGRGVPQERLALVAEHYMKFGGVSPINGQNRQLVASLQSELVRPGMDLPVFWGNRHWSPFLRDAIADIHAAGHRRVLALFTSAYSSYSGCRQYREELAHAVAECGLSNSLVIDKIRPYFDSPGFLGPFTDGIVDALNNLREIDGVDSANTRILFTTHSIPVEMNANSGAPAVMSFTEGTYVAQHKAAAAIVMDDVAKSGSPFESWMLVFQSRSGPPHIPWLEPDINDALRAASADGVQGVVVAPIGFVSDHMEVMWDLDNEAAATCKDLGLPMRRVRTPGTDSRFIKTIVDLVVERSGGAPSPALSTFGPWPAPCLPGCCANPRGLRPHLAGIDS